MRPPKKFHPEPFPYHHELELRIDSLTNLGHGVARVDGWVVFVPFCLPGEKVRARIYRNDKNCSHADLLEIIEASPDRVTPRCELFQQCGGCQYQHLNYAAQLRWKTQQIQELLQHMAGISFAVSPCHASPQQWNYRSKITPHFEKSAAAADMPIGFLAVGRRSQLLDVPQCPIAMESINQALPGVRAATRERSHKRGGTLLLRAGLQPNRDQAVVATNPRDTIEERCGDIRFQFIAGEFFQNNPFILKDFTRYVCEQARENGSHYLVDAYCGSGLFSLTAAHAFDECAGVEVSETAIEWARHNAKLNDISHVHFVAASAEAIFADLHFPADRTSVIIDPPRKGCTREFLDQLIQFQPARLVYVSCDPATQIRDLAILTAAGFVLRRVQPFDLFPHTRHLESVMTLDFDPSTPPT